MNTGLPDVSNAGIGNPSHLFRVVQPPDRGDLASRAVQDMGEEPEQESTGVAGTASDGDVGAHGEEKPAGEGGIMLPKASKLKLLGCLP
mmetsp:Transcript_93056/g.203713  ORF Transcript_93056/g.203713 Transcript_93056/m.203713 type:complete len:89 (-) Transcript_93056:218-484(-)